MMVQIIEENKQPKFSQQLMAGLGNAFGQASQGIPQMLAQRSAKQKQGEAYKQLVGQDISGFPPEIQKVIVENLMKGQGDSSKKNEPLQSGLATVKRMRELGKKGNLGRGSGVWSSLFGGETAKEYGEYEQLGKSLISLASNIPIRNKAEFETLAAGLYDPSIRDSEREGILNAMERIISQSMGNENMEVDSKNHREMRDEKGNVYDIPEELYEKARAKGLR